NGAAGMLVQSTPFGLAGLTGIKDFPMAAVEFATGDDLLAAVKKSPASTFTWSTTQRSFKVEAGGSPSDFSSWGLDGELRIKPDISAPGGNIYSTYPVNMGTYAILSGTSMATPYAAGAHALLYNAQKKIVRPLDARRIFKATATPGKFFKHEAIASVAKQGAGLINIKNAIALKTAISPEHIQLLDTNHFAGKSVEIKIQNTDKTTVTYTLSHETAESVVSYRGGNTFPLQSPFLEKDSASVKFSVDKITLAAGRTGKVNVQFTEPKTGKAEEFPLYSGYIVATPNGKGSIPVRIAYAGLKGNVAKVPIQDTEIGFPTLAIKDTASGNVTFPVKGQKINWATEASFIATRLGSHTPDLRLILVEAATNKFVGFLNTQYGAASLGSWGRNHYFVPRDPNKKLEYRTWDWVEGKVFATADAKTPFTPAAGEYKVLVASQHKLSKGNYPADFEIQEVAHLTI
ncbi:hypothetical protein BGZ94_003134, partial [Podila epigama]